MKTLFKPNLRALGILATLLAGIAFSSASFAATQPALHVEAPAVTTAQPENPPTEPQKIAWDRVGSPVNTNVV